MEADHLRFYLDENLPTEIAKQLQSRGIDAITVRDLNLLGESDHNHLQRATSLGRVLCTHDSDFIQLATDGVQHAGIIYGQQDKHYIGEWVNFLQQIHALYQSEELINIVKFVK